jgi:hypothetical protein
MWLFLIIAQPPEAVIGVVGFDLNVGHEANHKVFKTLGLELPGN